VKFIWYVFFVFSTSSSLFFSFSFLLLPLPLALHPWVGRNRLCLVCTTFYLAIQDLLEQGSYASSILIRVELLATCPPWAQNVTMTSLQKAHWMFEKYNIKHKAELYQIGIIVKKKRILQGFQKFGFTVIFEQRYYFF